MSQETLFVFEQHVHEQLGFAATTITRFFGLRFFGVWNPLVFEKV